jgi:natural product precursor
MKKMKLNALENQNLSNKEMNKVRGGDGCGCGCAYANSGGSSTGDNANANAAGGLHSPGTGGGGYTPSDGGGSSNATWTVPVQSASAYTVSS